MQNYWKILKMSEKITEPDTGYKWADEIWLIDYSPYPWKRRMKRKIAWKIEKLKFLLKYKRRFGR